MCEAASDFKTEARDTVNDLRQKAEDKIADVRARVGVVLSSPAAQNVRDRLRKLRWGKFTKG
jgi:hypothetical protein